MKLIVGLGNPGFAYKKTRHNVGFMFIDALLKYYHLKAKLDSALAAYTAATFRGQEKLIFLKPATYMNLSGNAVQKTLAYYKLSPDDLLVVHDDLDLAPGKVRIRGEGSSGGHRGMQNIIDLLHTTKIKRIRIGIGKNEAIGAIDYVLGRFTKSEKKLLEETLSRAPEIIDAYLSLSFDNLMSRYN